MEHETGEAAPWPVVKITRRETEQAHIVIGGKGLTRGDEKRWAFEVLNHVMGSGMSS